LREFVDEVYRLYDRRCHRKTALEKLRKLRERLKKFKRLSQLLKKIESPVLERSLVFLNDKQLPSTAALFTLTILCGGLCKTICGTMVR